MTPTSARFRAVVHAGRLVLEKPDHFKAYVRRLNAGPVLVRLDRPTQPRSIVSNRYYFGAVVRTIGEELGYADPEEMHDLIAFKFLREADDPVTGAPRRKRTHLMTSAEFSEYVNRVITWAEADLDIRIPRPHEWDGM